MVQLTTNDRMLFVNSTKVQEIIDNSPKGRNTKFLSASHSLWTRFKNYEKSPPMALEVKGEIVSLIFATFNRDLYSNLYEIVTVQGQEGKGYASRIWSEYTKYAVTERKIERLKISCTPSSITWHYKNGLIFWAVDPTGSLRSDQKLFSTREEQLEYREYSINNPMQALPPKEKVRELLRKEGLENYEWGEKKRARTEEAINNVGRAWLRDSLFNTTTLEEFLK